VTGSSYKVLIAHPARQQNIYERPLALYKRNRPVFFFTGLYYNPKKFPYVLVRFLPARWRERCLAALHKRRIENFDENLIVIVGGPWLEFIFRPFGLIAEWVQLFDRLMARWLRKNPKETQPTIVHCFQGSAVHTIEAAKEKGYISVFELTLPVPPAATRTDIHTPSDIQQDYQAPERDIKALRSADFFVVQSRSAIDIMNQWKIPLSKVILLPLGVDLEKFHPGPPRPSGAPFRALFVGQLGRRKGLHHLLEAWKQLALPNAELLLAGYPNEDGKELLKRYEGFYRFLGFVSDDELRRLFRESDVFLLPSWSEGAANVVYEAMASGLPCIVSEGACSIVRDGADGYIIPWADVPALKTQIRRLYDDPERRAQMAASARARAEHYSWDHFGRRLTSVYDAIINGQLAGRTTFFDTSDL
jgi:alpha-maltose-1-phosphate synthase